MKVCDSWILELHLYPFSRHWGLNIARANDFTCVRGNHIAISGDDSRCIDRRPASGKLFLPIVAQGRKFPKTIRPPHTARQVKSTESG
jgi:hypothetical protein